MRQGVVHAIVWTSVCVLLARPAAAGRAAAELTVTATVLPRCAVTAPGFRSLADAAAAPGATVVCNDPPPRAGAARASEATLSYGRAPGSARTEADPAAPGGMVLTVTY